MNTVVFLWIYLAVSLTISLILFGLYLTLLRYGYLIRRSSAAKATVIAILLISSLTFLWYSISITLTLFNKWFLTQWHGIGFKYPLLSTSVHMLMKFLLSRIWVLTTNDTPTDTNETYLWYVIPIGMLTALDISLSNASLIFIPVSLYTAVKASVLMYAFGFSIWFKLEVFKWSTFASILATAVGLGVAVLSSKHISFFGVSLCLGASISAGLRWVLMQYLVQSDVKNNHVLAVIYKLSPIAFMSLLPVAVMVEGRSLLTSVFFDEGSLILQAFSLCLSGGLISSVLIFTEMVSLCVCAYVHIRLLYDTYTILVNTYALGCIIFFYIYHFSKYIYMYLFVRIEILR
jgi:solute carrier family 35 protein C2